LTEIFYLLKNLAVKEGYVPDAYKAQSMTVFDNGVAVPYMAPMIRARKELGLEQNLEENIVIPVQELQALMEATGMKEIVEKFKAEKAAAAPAAKPSE
jgi:heterodisulfide reductase subunit C